MHSNQKLAFIKWGDFSHINASVIEMLTKSFSNFHIEVIELSDLISKKDVVVLFCCLKEYWVDILLNPTFAIRGVDKPLSQ